jgi:tRNA threonylcarbamoyladenosine biosynthesis protein TsaE
MIIHSASSEQTVAAGRSLAARARAPLLILLSGELGAGKTTLAKGIISGLGAAREEDVMSPTFTLIHSFQAAGDAPLRVYHVDLYRIESGTDLATLGLEDLFDLPAIILVEWPDRLRGLGGRIEWPTWRVHLQHAADDARRIEIAEGACREP